jgi:putative oxidoreductase
VSLVKAQRWGLLALRTVVGITFMMHGGQKYFILGFSAVIPEMIRAGIPYPVLAAVVVTFVELVGGGLVFLGLATRYAALLIAIEMAVAIWRVHWAAGFFAPQGVELPLVLLGAAVALALTGPGDISMDDVLFGKEK